MAESLSDIRDSFAFFDDWEEKYAFLLELGRGLPNLDEADRRDEFLVRGCQSQVWLLPDYVEDDKRLRFRIDSDAHIVRGLIAIVLAAYDERQPREILDFDMAALFDELDLLSHLSSTRGNGLRAMVNRIRSIAEAHVVS